MSKMNPLSKYTKIEVLSVDLCSGENLVYKKNVVKEKNCGVCARSARDELMFNNPEFLINGEAVVNVIENCVENVQSARDLYTQDVEQLLVAIKIATDEKTYDVGAICPKCEKEGVFERDLEYLMDTVVVPEDEVFLTMEESGLNVFFRPHTWGESNKFALKAYQIQQKINILEQSENLSDEEKVKHISPLITDIARLQFDSSVCHISRIEMPEEGANVVTDQNMIKDWLETLKSADYKAIMKKIDEVNDFGISRKMDCECTCGHQWVMEDIKLDPSTFFAPRS